MGHLITKDIKLVSDNGKHAYNKNHTWIPFYMEMAEKLLDFKKDRKPLLDIVYSLDKKFVGYIKTDEGGQVNDIDPFTVFSIFNRGITHNHRFKLCRYFKEKLTIEAEIPADFDGVPVVNNMMATFFWREYADTDIQPLWDLFEAVTTNNESAFKVAFNKVCKQHGIKWNITMGLFWIRPYDFISLDSRNRDYLPTFGVEVFKENQIDSAHYLALLSCVKEKIANKKINEGSIPEISYQAWISDHTSLTRTDSNMNKNYWLVGFTYGDNDSQLERFFKDGIWESRYDDDSTNDQNMLALTKAIKKGDIIILKSTSTKGKEHKIPFLRVKGVGIAKSDIAITKQESWTQCACPVSYISTDDTNFEGSTYGKYRKTIHQADGKVQTIIDYVENLLSPTSKQSVPTYKEYIDLLTENHNLVLTGAPGTGKTYLAQTIAEEMGCTKDEICFVQFHPSYDYTDFVEGLRPVEKNDGQMGFERKDGVFKEFCKRAIKNLVDSQKSVESLTKELSWEEKLQQFIEDAVENNTAFTLSNGSVFTIEGIKGRSIVAHNEQNEKTTQVLVSADDVLALLTNDVSLNIVRDIRNYFNRKFGTQPDSYAFIITKEIRKMKTMGSMASVNKIDRKPFVFIIDEINRGEASKIFGELFYAIDPGYRGKQDVRVKTQYQNLVPETDVFAEGFYVPENMYILATMNDIDRSVESMDFAMRRRFTWKEVTPESTQYMLDDLTCADEAKQTMRRLNDVITNTEGLGTAYQVGPSYFLKLNENGGNFEKLWKMNIEPLLREYLRGFRKSEGIMAKLSDAYFGTDTAPSDTDIIELADED
ncbi:MAG: AAA family ATPase [Erysipelotrichaceae bacterium]|nr:AAA family ATPase [Erysipelotrichaceae bacterium]